MGILLLVLKFMYISLLLKMIYGFSRPAKITASPFKSRHGDSRVILATHLDPSQGEEFLEAQ